ncbi:MFS transporter [Utexia brackfieldae]|uniref:MFS transporter n=1 Tax=Utexia brackfieldae TaxID=3074108 RepID=UPI00370DC98A
MAFATGITVASNYYAQPLLHSITSDLSVSMEHAGIIITIAQFSYALGLLFITPLGDKFERKSLILALMLLSTLGLAISANATSIEMLLVGTAIAGLFSAVAQVLIPFAATIATPASRGRIVGVLMAGLLLGILLARTFAGTVSSFGQWRTVYAVAALIMALVTICLAISLPRFSHKININYWRLIGSIGSLFIQEPILRIRALMGGIAFCLFSLLWTPLAFLLSAEPYHYSDFIIGLFGIAGAAGALASPIVGRLSDKGRGILVTTVGLVALLIAWLPLSFAQSSLCLLILGIVVIDFAVQVTHVSCMNAIYQIRPEARSRMNSGYMVSYFIGGMIGSISSTYLFSLYGWLAIVYAGSGLAILALMIWVGYVKAVNRCQK